MEWHASARAASANARSTRHRHAGFSRAQFETFECTQSVAYGIAQFPAHNSDDNTVAHRASSNRNTRSVDESARHGRARDGVALRAQCDTGASSGGSSQYRDADDH